MPESTHTWVRTGSYVLMMLVTVATAAMVWQATSKDVEANTREIERVDSDGCKPSVSVRSELGILKNEQKHLIATTEKMENQLDNIAKILMRIEEKGL